MTTRTFEGFAPSWSSTLGFACHFGLAFNHAPTEVLVSEGDFLSKYSLPPARMIRLARSAHASITNRCGGKQYCIDQRHLALLLVTSKQTHLRIEIRGIEIDKVQFLPHHSGV